MYKRSRNINGHELWHEDNIPRHGLSRHAALAALKAEMVYAVRLGDVIKIGHTTDLACRVRTLAHTNGSEVEVLAFRLGDRAAEQELHGSLKPHRARGREYYNPTPEVMAVVNDMRDDFDLPHITA